MLANHLVVFERNNCKMGRQNKALAKEKNGIMTNFLFKKTHFLLNHYLF